MRDDAAGKEAEVHGCSTSGQRHHFLPLAYELLQIVFEPVHIRAKGDNPVGVKCLLNKLLLITGQVAKAKEDSFLSFSISVYIF